MKEFIVWDEETNEILGREYLTETGLWMHKWFSKKDNEFERVNHE